MRITCSKTLTNQSLQFKEKFPFAETMIGDQMHSMQLHFNRNHKKVGRNPRIIITRSRESFLILKIAKSSFPHRIDCRCDDSKCAQEENTYKIEILFISWMKETWDGIVFLIVVKLPVPPVTGYHYVTLKGKNYKKLRKSASKIGNIPLCQRNLPKCANLLNISRLFAKCFFFNWCIPIGVIVFWQLSLQANYRKLPEQQSLTRVRCRFWWNKWIRNEVTLYSAKIRLSDWNNEMTQLCQCWHEYQKSASEMNGVIKNIMIITPSIMSCHAIWNRCLNTE